MDLFGKNETELVLDCSSSDLKVAVGRYNAKNRSISIDKVGIIPLESDAINDGAIADSFGIVMAVKHAMARLDIRNKSCILTTEGAFVHTRDLELPIVKKDQLKDMVKYEVMGQGSNRELSIDYIVYGTAIDEETNADKLKVRATAVPTDVIKEYREFLKNLDLTPISLDVNPNAVRKLFSSGIINGNVSIVQSTLLLIELSSRTTTVTVLDHGFSSDTPTSDRLLTPSRRFRAASSSLHSHDVSTSLLLMLMSAFRLKISMFGTRQSLRLLLFSPLLMRTSRALLMLYPVQLNSLSPSIVSILSAHASFMVQVQDIRRSIRNFQDSLEHRLKSSSHSVLSLVLEISSFRSSSTAAAH